MTRKVVRETWQIYRRGRSLPVDRHGFSYDGPDTMSVTTLPFPLASSLIEQLSLFERFICRATRSIDRYRIVTDRLRNIIPRGRQKCQRAVTKWREWQRIIGYVGKLVTPNANGAFCKVLTSLNKSKMLVREVKGILYTLPTCLNKYIKTRTRRTAGYFKYFLLKRHCVI